MQKKSGTVTVTNGSNVVTGLGTNWLEIDDEVEAGDLFKINDIPTLYQIASVESDTQIHLSVNYAGTSGSGLSYCIVMDFTPNNNLPLISKGDIDWPDLWNRALAIMDLFSVVGLVGMDTGLAAPTTGYHALTFIRWNTNPVPGENIGWICTEAGTPGVFKPWGMISL